MGIKEYGFHPTSKPDAMAGIPARITAVCHSHYEFISDSGAGLARLKASQYREGMEDCPTAGDFVLLKWQPAGESVILHTLPRKSCFSRRDPSSAGHGKQAIAANFDYVFIMQSLDNDYNPRRLERYLSLAWQSGGTPVVVLTKADTQRDFSSHLRLAESLSEGARVHAVSAQTGYGIDALDAYLKPGKTIVFLGSSGVGKSSFINAIAGRTLMRTNSVRAKDGRGRHTTTRRQLLLLESGVIVIDTPGMRELGMWDADNGLQKAFGDVEQYFGQCKFSDCRHQSEPGCAVKAAIGRNDLSQARWESYQRLQAENQYDDDRAGYLRRKEKWHRDIAISLKRRKEADYRHAPCDNSFVCTVCGAPVVPENAGSQHRNHCPHCLSSLHVDNKPGDRASLCKGIMDPVGIWVRKNGEWAIIHRCRSCGVLHANRIAADDSQSTLMDIATKPLASPAFPG